MNSNFTIAHEYGLPVIVLGIFTLIALIVVLVRLERSHVKRLHAFIEMHLAPRLLLGGEAGKRKPMFWCSLVGCLMLLTALAQPHWGRAMEEQTQRSHNLLFVLDVIDRGV